MHRLEPVKYLMDLKRVMKAPGMRFHLFLPTIQQEEILTWPSEILYPCNHLHKGPLARNSQISRENTLALLRI